MDRGNSGDSFSNVDYSLLAPRPFRSQQQYQSVFANSAGPGAVSPARSLSPRPTGQERQFGIQDNSFGRLPNLSPQEPPQWGFIGDQRGQPRSTMAGAIGGKERLIPIKVLSVGGRKVESQVPLTVEPSRNNGPKATPNSFFRQQPSQFGFHNFPEVGAPRSPSVLGIGHNGGRTERVIPVKVEGAAPRRLSAPGMEPIRLQQQPVSKTVRFSDLEEERRRHAASAARSSPILSSPVFAEERRAPVRAGSVVRQIPVTLEPDVSSTVHKSQIRWDPVMASSGSDRPVQGTLPPAKYGDHSAATNVHRFAGNNGRWKEEVTEAPPMVKMFDAAIIDGPLKDFLDLSVKIGGDVDAVGALTKEAFQAQRVFLWNAAGMPKPGDGELSNLLKPTSDKLEAIQNMKSSKRTSAFFNHLSAIAEGIPALGWVTVSPTPAPFIKEMSDASQFYTNRVLKDFKEKDKTHADWVKAWLQTLSELQQFVKQNHTTGLVWNTTPGAKSQSAAGPPAPPPIGSMPPPPPPPPADFGANLGAAGADARAALFADINKGLDITKGLKKVSADMQTHKNPALKQQPPAGPGAAGDQGKPSIPPKPAHLTNGSGNAAVSTGQKKPTTAANEPAPVLTCEGGKKWIVEYHKGNKNITIEIENMKQVVYIYKCVDCVVQIKGKANSITMDSCKKTSLVFDNLLSCIDIINCQSAQVQTLGAMPTLAIQKTDGCQVYLSRESLNAEIVTSKSSEMNVLVPDASGEFHEFPVPEQYRTIYKGNKLVTEVVDIA